MRSPVKWATTQRLAAAKSNLGILEFFVGRTGHAIAALREALAIDTREGDQWAIAVDQSNLGAAFSAAGEIDGARRALAVALGNVVELGDSDLLVSTLETCVLLACASNDHEKAIVLAGGADALRRVIEIPRTTLENALLDAGSTRPAPPSIKSDMTARSNGGRACDSRSCSPKRPR